MRIAAAILVLVLTACAPSGPGPSPTAKTSENVARASATTITLPRVAHASASPTPTLSVKTFASLVTWQGIGATLSLPRDWLRASTGASGEVFAARETDADGATSAVVSVEHLAVHGAPTSDEVIEALLAGAQRPDAKLELHARRHIDLPAGPAEFLTLWVDAAGPDGPIAMTMQLVMVPRGVDYYFISLTTRRADADAYELMFAVVTDSFRVT